MTDKEFYDPERLAKLSFEETVEFFREHEKTLPERRRLNRARIENMFRASRGQRPIPIK